MRLAFHDRSPAAAGYGLAKPSARIDTADPGRNAACNDRVAPGSRARRRQIGYRPSPDWIGET